MPAPTTHEDKIMGPSQTPEIVLLRVALIAPATVCDAQHERTSPPAEPDNGQFSRTAVPTNPDAPASQLGARGRLMTERQQVVARSTGL